MFSTESGPGLHLPTTTSTFGPLTAEGDPLLEVLLGERLVGDGRPCFVIAEIGINHNGDAQIARKLIDVASSGPVVAKWASSPARHCCLPAPPVSSDATWSSA